MADVRALYRYAMDNPGADPPAFDFNGDGRFDMYDVQALLRQIGY